MVEARHVVVAASVGVRHVAVAVSVEARHVMEVVSVVDLKSIAPIKKSQLISR